MKKTVYDHFNAYLKDPDLSASDLISCLEKMRSNWTQQRQNEHDQRWRQSLAFYAGHHNIRNFSRTGNQYRVELKENHTNNIVQRMVSVFVQNMPITRVFPASDSSKDVKDAENCESYIKYFYKTKDLENKYAKFVKSCTIFGNAFLFRQYDPYAGGSMLLSEDEGGENKIKKWRGDVKIEIDDPFRIAVRLGIDEMSDMYDFFRSVPANKSELEAEHGSIDSESVVAINAYNGQLRTDDDLIQVHHYYHKPTSWCDEGIYVCYAGKKVLKGMTWPYKSHSLPIEHLSFDKPPMCFWGLSTIDQVMDLQEQVNRAASMIIEARNLIARPRVLVSEEAKIPGQAFSDRPGDIIRYKQSGGKPEFYVPNFNFTELANHKADVRAALQQVSGMSSASRGEIPAATKTALALQLVLEQDRSQWAPFVKLFYRSIQETNRGILDIAAQYFTEDDPRVIKVEKLNRFETATFHGGMVPSELDVWLEDTNPLGWTASGRIEAVQNLVQAGVLKDNDQVLEMLKLNNPNSAYKEQTIARATAQKENELLKKGIFVEVESEDIDPIHINEHAVEMMTVEYKSFPPFIKKLFEDHINIHKSRLPQQPVPPDQVSSPQKLDLSEQLAPPEAKIEELIGG
jgi:hypothetical protein